MTVSQSVKQDIFSIKTAARDFYAGQISEWTLRTWIRLGKLRAYKAGSRVILKKEDLEKMLRPLKES